MPSIGTVPVVVVAVVAGAAVVVVVVVVGVVGGGLFGSSRSHFEPTKCWSQTQGQKFLSEAPIHDPDKQPSEHDNNKVSA